MVNNRLIPDINRRIRNVSLYDNAFFKKMFNGNWFKSNEIDKIL